MSFFCSVTLSKKSCVYGRETGDTFTNETLLQHEVCSKTTSHETNNNVNDESPNVRYGFTWDCGESCLFDRNTYTNEVNVAIGKAYNEIVSFQTSHTHELVNEMKKPCCMGDISKKDHHELCYQTSSVNTFQNMSGCASFFLTLTRLQHHFPAVRTLVHCLYDMKRSYEEASRL